jgi:RNA polymerase sigma-70 factor, ECF subfamily
LEATASAPGPGSPAQAINGPRSAGSAATPTPFAASALAVGGGRGTLDDESREWLESLAAAPRGEALVRLRALLLRATQFEVARRRDQLLHVDDRELQKLAHTAADTALIRVVAGLAHYRGGSRFTTWAAKFALLETATRMRKLGWHDGHPPSWRQAREGGLSSTLQAALSDLTEALTADQCYVFEALTVDGVPIDVLAEDMGTTRGDVYQTLQSARAMLRARLANADSV